MIRQLDNFPQQIMEVRLQTRELRRYGRNAIAACDRFEQWQPNVETELLEVMKRESLN